MKRYKSYEYKGCLIVKYTFENEELKHSNIVAFGEDEDYNVHSFATDSLKKAKDWLEKNNYTKKV